MPTRTVTNPAELDGLVDELLSILPQKQGAHVLALSGDLGAGKTTFTQALARKLGVSEHVVSPTFVIMKRYDTQNEQFSSLVHIDAYRIEDEKEVAVLGLDRLMDEEDIIICIEWPERVPSYIPDDALHITFTIASEETRTITYGS